MLFKLIERSLPKALRLDGGSLRDRWRARRTIWLPVFEYVFDELPCLLILNPTDFSQFLIVNLRDANLTGIYTALRDEFTKWAHEHDAELAIADTMWALQTRQWRHPAMIRVEREFVIPKFSSALMNAAKDSLADCAVVSQQFKNCCSTVPLNIPRLSRVLRYNGNLTLTIDGSTVDEASLVKVYERILREAIEVELARFTEPVEIPPFQLARLNHLGSIRQTVFAGVAVNRFAPGLSASSRSETAAPELMRIVEKAYGTAGSSSFPGVSVFVSYSHRDETFKDDLDKHLAAAKRSGLVHGLGGFRSALLTASM